MSLCDAALAQGSNTRGERWKNVARARSSRRLSNVPPTRMSALSWGASVEVDMVVELVDGGERRETSSGECVFP